MVAQLVPLKEWCKANEIGYAHALTLIRDGLFSPAVRIGRKLYVHLGLAEEWGRSGGSRFPGGWRKGEPQAGEAERRPVECLESRKAPTNTPTSEKRACGGLGPANRKHEVEPEQDFPGDDR